MRISILDQARRYIIPAKARRRPASVGQTDAAIRRSCAERLSQAFPGIVLDGRLGAKPEAPDLKHWLPLSAGSSRSRLERICVALKREC
jgi:hypothetical protein